MGQGEAQERQCPNRTGYTIKSANRDPHTSTWFAAAAQQIPQKPPAHDGRKAIPSCPRLCWLPEKKKLGLSAGDALDRCACGQLHNSWLYREKGAGRQRDLRTDARWEGCHCNSRYVHYFSFKLKNADYMVI